MIEKKIKCVGNALLEPDEVLSKLIELEDRSHRNNPQIDGIQKAPNKAWD